MCIEPWCGESVRKAIHLCEEYDGYKVFVKCEDFDLVRTKAAGIDASMCFGAAHIKYDMYHDDQMYVFSFNNGSCITLAVDAPPIQVAFNHLIYPLGCEYIPETIDAYAMLAFGVSLVTYNAKRYVGERAHEIELSAPEKEELYSLLFGHQRPVL